MSADVALAHAAAGRAHNKQQRPLVPFRVRDPDCSGFGNAWAANRGILELDRADPLPARLDHVLGPVGDLERPIWVNDPDVAGIEPLLVIGRILGSVEVALDDPVAANLQAAAGLAVPRQNAAVIVDDAQ